ncbi:MAG: CerR family C-terminal domain-containing protein [Pirellulaceae bacterium]|nr:CerR family C-terminal domain-containing protein [Planctomycetales bacterium]MCA9223039.1 CerR family C-terminal domain-containing protein [Planctomycetales bacterium]
MSDDDSRSRVLQAAGPIFAEKGFQAATVREICHAANVNLASVNYYFRDKENLYIETVRQARERRAARAPLPHWQPDTPPERRLRDFIHTMLTRMLAGSDEAWQVRLMMREILQPTEACREMVEDYFRPQFEILLGILTELLPDHTPPHRLRQIGFSVVGQCMHYRVSTQVVEMITPPDEHEQYYGIEQLADHIATFTVAAVRHYDDHLSGSERR